MFHCFMTIATLFADAQQAPAQPDPAAQWGGMLVPMVAIAFLWYFLLFRPQKQEQTRRSDLLKSLKKNDKVVTIGGVIGTVANLSADGKEVTIKVDDNSRIRFLRSSVQTVLMDEDKSDGEAS